MTNKIGIVFFVLAATFNWLSGQTVTTVYLLPGTGSDARLFDLLSLPSGYQAKHILYPIPEKNATMSGYARVVAQQIDTTQPFVLVGVSIG